MEAFQEVLGRVGQRAGGSVVRRRRAALHQTHVRQLPVPADPQVPASGFEISDLGCRVEGLGFRV